MLDLQIIILAAGKGTRMGADKPKVLVEMAGKPLISHLLDELSELDLGHTPGIVVGYEAQKVKQALGGAYEYVLQENQLGTGHAVQQTKTFVQDQDPQSVLVLYGDMPLVQADTIKRMYNQHQSGEHDMTMATTDVDDFSGWKQGFESFGRIIRNDEGKITEIIEKDDANESQLSITEVNPSYLCFNPDWLWKHIDDIDANNSQDEYYLTELVEIAVESGAKLGSASVDPIEALGANTPEQLERMEKLYNQKILT